MMFRSAFLCLALTLSLSAVDVASLTPTTISVAENASVSDVTLISRGADGRTITGVTYAMAANGHWNLLSASGPLHQTNTYNFESTTETADKTITIFATGPGGTAKPFTITVTVTDVNEAPTGATFSGAQAIDENATGVAAVGVAVGDLDASATNSYVWSLVNPPSGINDNGNFSINWSTGSLSVNTAFDFELLDPTNRRLGTTDKIFVRAFVSLQDGAFTAVTKEVWIEVRDVNEAPTGVTVSGAQVIDENATGVVAASASLGDVDPPATNAYVWSLVDPPSGINDNANFAIDAATGALSVSTAFNYETLTATAANRRNGTTDKIFARASISLKDGSFTAITKRVWIEVRDVKEAPTGVTFSGVQAIDENGTDFVTASASSGDDDHATNNSYVWSLVAPPSGINDNPNFTIDEVTGALSVSSAFDYEALISTAASRRNGTTDKIFVRAFVSLKDGLFAAVKSEVWIEIKDVNEAPTGVTFGGAQTIDENASGVVATSASTGDVDTPATNRYVWSLAAPPSGINDNANFTIDGATGALSVTGPLDYETLVATAASRRNGTANRIFARAFVALQDASLTAITKEEWIEVRDVNEAPTGMTFSGPQAINEHATGAVAVSASIGDPDAPATNSYAWSLVTPPGGINDNANFSIDGATGALSVGGAFDYEALVATAVSRRNGTANRIFARAFVSLQDGVLQAVTKEVWIEIKDVNEAPTGVAAGGVQTISENAIGEVATCSSTGDPDASATNRYAWSLVAPPSGLNDNARFTVNPDNGILTLTTPCDYEGLHDSHLSGGIVVLHAWVQLIDGAFIPINKEVLITLTDVDEPPVIAGWVDGTSLTDPTVDLRVGDDPGFSVVDPDIFNPGFQNYDTLSIHIELKDAASNDELGLLADLLSPLTLSTSGFVSLAKWPFATAVPGVLASAKIATMSRATTSIEIQFNVPVDAASTPVGHVDATMLKEVVRTIMFGNANRNYSNRGVNPSVEISYPVIGGSPTYKRLVDVANINAAATVSQVLPIGTIVRGSTGNLDSSALIVTDDHAEAPAFLVIDSLPTAGVLQRIDGTTVTLVQVGDSIPLVRISTSNQLACPAFRYQPSPSSSVTTDSFICHALDGGVMIGQAFKFKRPSPLTRISLKIDEAAIPRFGTPENLTYAEQTPAPLLVGASLSFAVSATSFGNWRFVVNGVASTSVANNGLDPHDVLSLAPGLVTRVSNTLLVGTVLIGSIVDGYDGDGRPLAIDFTDMVGLTNVTATEVVLALAKQVQFSSSSRIMAQNLGDKHSLFIGFVGRTSNQSSFIELPVRWVGVPDAPTWVGAARVVMSRVQTVSGTLVCRDVDSGPGSPVDPSLVTFNVLDGANSVTLGQPVVTSGLDGWQYLVPWTWSVVSGTADATGGTFRVRAANVVGSTSDPVITGFADTTITIAVTGNESATLTFVNDAPMGLLASGTSGAWRVNLDQQLRVIDGDGVAVTSDQLQYALAGSPPLGTAIDPQTGTLQIHFIEATTVPTAEYRFAVLANSVAKTATSNGILPVVLIIGATPNGSN